MSEFLGDPTEKALSEMQIPALLALARFDPDAERKILAGYDGAEAIKKEIFFRRVIAAVYFEAFLAGQADALPDDMSTWGISVTDKDEGENDE